MSTNREFMKKIARRHQTEHLISLDNVTYGENFVDIPLTDVNEPYVIYGLVEGNDGLHNWLNPSRNGAGDDTVIVKVGMLHSNSKVYAGMSVREAVLTRANQQVTASQSIVYYPVFVFPSNKTDDAFREFVFKKCIKKAKMDGENAPLSLNSAKRWFTKYQTGIDRTENYEMFPKQHECVDKMKAYFASNETQGVPSYFLLAAKPRFGKNFTLLNFIKEFKIKTSVFVSYLPTVFSSIGDELETHVLFDGWRHVDYRNERDYTRSGDEVTVLTTSAQLLNYVEDGLSDEYSIEDMNILRDSLMNLADKNVELLVFDEAHFGANSEYVQNIINTLRPKYVVFVTGTASKYRNDERFSDDNTFEYDYIDECNDPSEHAKKMPKIRIYTYEMDKELVAKAKEEYHTEEFVTMTKLFECDKRGRFIHEGLVEAFFKEVMGKRGFSKENIKLNSVSPFNNPDIEGKFDHSFAIVPSVAAAKASVKLMRKLGFADEFEFYNAAGSDGIKDIDEIKRKIQTAKSKNMKTMTFVCDRFREGVTVPDLGAVFCFDDGKSLDRYIQTMFRVQSPLIGKTECFVFDYCPERCLAMRYAHKHYYRKSGYTEEQMEAVLYDCMPITYYDCHGNIVENDNFKNAMFAATHKFFGGFKGFGESMFAMSKWAEFSDEIAYMFDGISFSGHRDTTINGQTNGLRGGKLKEHINRVRNGYRSGTSSGEKDARKAYEELVKLCIEAMKGIPEFLLLSGSKYGTIKEVVNSSDGDIFEELTCVKLDEFKSLVDGGFFRTESINDLIYQFYRDKDEIFDLAMEYIDNSEDYDEAIEMISEFENKWIYGKKAEQIDVPYKVLRQIDGFLEK